MKYPEIKIGQRYGKLTVLALGKASNRSKDRMWLCQCDCGNTKLANDMRLKNGYIRSCGCLVSQKAKEAQTTHGLSKTPLYAVWRGIKARCNNPNCKAYSNYGGRGITVCDEWNNSFESFMEWAVSNGYNESLSIDRIDNDKGYYPYNCRWVDVYVQANNMSHNKRFSYNGETHTLADWSRILNVNYTSLKKRYDSGWSVEDIVNKPYRKHRPYKAKRKSEVDTK